MTICPTLSVPVKSDKDSGIFTPELIERNKMTIAQVNAGINFFKLKSTFCRSHTKPDAIHFGFGVKGYKKN